MHKILKAWWPQSKFLKSPRHQQWREHSSHLVSCSISKIQVGLYLPIVGLYLPIVGLYLPIAEQSLPSLVTRTITPSFICAAEGRPTQFYFAGHSVYTLRLFTLSGSLHSHAVYSCNFLIGRLCTLSCSLHAHAVYTLRLFTLSCSLHSQAVYTLRLCTLSGCVLSGCVHSQAVYTLRLCTLSVCVHSQAV